MLIRGVQSNIYDGKWTIPKVCYYGKACHNAVWVDCYACGTKYNMDYVDVLCKYIVAS